MAEPSLRSRKVINSGYRRLIGFYCSLTFANLFYLHILFYYTWDFITPNSLYLKVIIIKRVAFTWYLFIIYSCIVVTNIVQHPSLLKVKISWRSGNLSRMKALCGKRSHFGPLMCNLATVNRVWPTELLSEVSVLSCNNGSNIAEPIHFSSGVLM